MITEEQRIARQSGIGGSDAAAIMGLSPYATPLQLWLQKTGQAEPPNLDDAEPVQWGNVLEDPVAKEFARRLGIRLAKVNATLQHKDFPFMLGHLDRRVVGAPEIVEIKTVRGLDDDAPRPDHVYQVRHYMAVTNMLRAHIVYLVAGQTLKHYIIERDGKIEQDMIAREREFWQHVESHTPPPVMSALDARLLFEQGTEATTLADAKVMEAAARLRELRAYAKTLEGEIETCQAAIMAGMGDASTLLDAEGRTLATWKSAKPSRSFDRARFEKEQPELAERYMVERPGSRRFLLKEIKEAAA